MYKTWLIFLLILLTTVSLKSKNPNFKFEGILGNRCENINSLAMEFIPYNPVIVEIGAYEGKITKTLAKTYPYGRIFSFEPQSNAYSQLVENMKLLPNVSTINLAVNTFNGQARLSGSGKKASLLSMKNKRKGVNVPCVVLDDWCESNGIGSIDFLCVGVGGLEWQICHSSPRILKTISVIVIKTHVEPSNRSIVSSKSLKRKLESLGFKLLSHRYEEGKEGEAIFIRKCMYDSIFN